MQLKYLFAFFTFSLFIIYFYYKKNRNRAYVTFVLCLFPFLDLHITNETLGGITVFDIISYYALFTLPASFLFKSNHNYLYHILFLSLCLITMFGCFESDFIKNALLNTIKFLSIFIFAQKLIEECQFDLKYADQIIKYIKCVCVISIVFLSIQLVVGLKFTIYPDLNPNTYYNGVIRYPSFFFDPQVYAQFLATTSFLFLITDKAKSKIQIICSRLIFIAILLVIFQTGGRAGLSGLAAGLLIVFISSKKKLQMLTAAFFFISIFLLIPNFTNSLAIFNREAGISESFAIRLRIWKEAIQVFVKNPFLGIGIGNYANYNNKYFAYNGYYLVDNQLIFYGTENGYLTALTECGIIGFCNLLFFIIIPIRSAVQLYLQKKASGNIFFIIAGVFSWLIAFFSTNTLDDKRSLILLTTFICLLLSAKKMQIERQQHA